MTTLKVPDEAWPAIGKLRDHLHLSYRAVGEALGVSASLVKLRLNDYEYYIAPNGAWSYRKRRDIDFADPVESVDEGRGGGPASDGLHGAG